MSERTRFLKENSNKVREVCKIMEDMRNETLKENAVNIAKQMIEAGKYVLEEIVNISGLSLDDVKKLQADKNA